MMFLHGQTVCLILSCLVLSSFSSSSGENSGISSHGSNGENALSGNKRTRIDLNKPAQSYASTAHSVQKNDKESLKDTASSPSASSSKELGKMPNPFPKGSMERKMETRRRQAIASNAAHARRRQARLALRMT